MPRVVIVGAGFGGLQCAKRLAGKPVEVLLLDRHNYHLFTPLLYQVASSLLNPSDIAYPVRAVFRKDRNITFRVAEVRGVDLERRVVRTEGGDESYDYLVLATGARVNFFGQDALAQRAFWLNDLPGALQLRNHVLSCFEAAATAADTTGAADATGTSVRRLLTFVVVGGGPTGVEYAGALAELVRLIAANDYPNLGRDDVRIVLVEGTGRILPAFPDALGAHARCRLERLGVTVRLSELVQSVGDGTVLLKSGQTIAAETLVWAAGVTPNCLSDGLAAPRRPNGRLEVDACLRLPGQERVFAIGDVAGYVQGGAELPLLAQPAMQAGRAVAENVLRDLRGLPSEPFRYKDPGIMATIGRNAGVALIRGVALTGWLGWASWLAVHLFFIIGFRNRIAVLLRWAWNYVFYDRPIRFIVREARRGVPHVRA